VATLVEEFYPEPPPGTEASPATQEEHQAQPTNNLADKLEQKARSQTTRKYSAADNNRPTRH